MNESVAIIATLATVIAAIAGWAVALYLRHNLREARRVRHTPAE